ncbi:MAG: 30S ribosomal protein S6--L-glutamate ligase, partial [Euryarchaeota archaeon]|nr:30S ribosomal protein S6--L-glutamate ligase [Euryarchaeota archaeon]
EISPKLAQIAVNAAKILELDFAGVDLLESKRGPLVLEVNSSPGLEGIEKASQVNVAGAVANFLNEKLQAIEEEKNQFDSGSASSSAGDFTHAF